MSDEKYIMMNIDCVRNISCDLETPTPEEVAKDLRNSFSEDQAKYPPY